MEKTRNMSIARKENPFNCIAHYRWEKDLPYGELAVLLGCSGPLGAYVACSREEADPSHVKALAEVEGMSIGEFLVIFREGELM